MRTYQRVIIFAITILAVGIPALSQTQRSSRPPSLSTEDVRARRIPPRAPKPGAITELRVLTESLSELDNKQRTFKGDDCSFELPDYGAKYFDHNDDGLVDFLEIRVRCPEQRAELAFSTDKMGFNIFPGSYEGAIPPSYDQRAGRPGLYLGLERGCGRSAIGSFKIHEAEFDLSGSIPALVTFAVSFEQACLDDNNQKKIKGTFYYNAVPVKAEPQPRPAERKGRPKAR